GRCRATEGNTGNSRAAGCVAHPYPTRPGREARDIAAGRSIVPARRLGSTIGTCIICAVAAVGGITLAVGGCDRVALLVGDRFGCNCLAGLLRCDIAGRRGCRGRVFARGGNRRACGALARAVATTAQRDDTAGTDDGSEQERVDSDAQLAAPPR